MKKFLIVILMVPLLAYCQERGIHFENQLTWPQIIAKAKAENKYIFVDCYATWCAPCKWMDQEVYNTSEVGRWFNANFISVKVQADTSANDNAYIKSWYKDASEIFNQNKIAELPTLLFYSPDGKPVHRLPGRHDAYELIMISQDAMAPKHQNYAMFEQQYSSYQKMLNEYRAGNRDSTALLQLYKAAASFYEGETEKEVADSYMPLLSTQQILNARGYNFQGLLRPYWSQHDPIAIATVNRCLNSLNDDNELLQKRHLEFVCNFTESSNTLFFKFIYQHQDTVNKIVDPANYVKGGIGYSQNYLETIIAQEELPDFDQQLKTSTKEPDWTKYYKRIKKKYSQDVADRIITSQKMSWYEFGPRKNFNLSAQSILDYLDLIYVRHPTKFDGYAINGDLYSIFQHCTDPVLLKKALEWNERLFNQLPRTLTAAYIVDTYANLLYKTGNVDDAIKWEQKAIALNPKSQSQQDALAKMQNGLPTW